MANELQFESWIPVPLPRVFAFFANPLNLPRLMPPATRTRIDSVRLMPAPPSPDHDGIAARRAAGKGSVIETSFQPLPFVAWRRKWTAVIAEFEWDNYFADAQQNGPFKRWHHRHEFRGEEREGLKGTMVRDVIEYEVGFGVLGRLANFLFVERQLRGVFANRQKVLPGFFRGMPDELLAGAQSDPPDLPSPHHPPRDVPVDVIQSRDSTLQD